METKEITVDHMLVVRRDELKSEIRELEFQYDSFVWAKQAYKDHDITGRIPAVDIRISEIDEKLSELYDESELVDGKMDAENLDLAIAYCTNQIKTPVFSEIARKQNGGTARIRHIVRLAYRLKKDDGERRFGIGELTAFRDYVENIVLGIPHGYYGSDEFLSTIISTRKADLRDRMSTLYGMATDLNNISEGWKDAEDGEFEQLEGEYQSLFSETVNKFGN